MCQFEARVLQARNCNINNDSNTSCKSMMWWCLRMTLIIKHADCYLDDCNRMYKLCNPTMSLRNVSSESSPTCRELSSGEQTDHSNEQPINCTIIVVPNEIIMRCQKGGCNHTAISTNTDCKRELGCDQGKQTAIASNRFLNLILVQFDLL